MGSGFQGNAMKPSNTVCVCAQSLSCVDSLQPHGLKPTRLLCPWDSLRREYWSGLSFPTTGDLPDPGIQSASLSSPAFAAGFFTTSSTWEALYSSLVAQVVKNPPAMQDTPVRFLGWEDPLKLPTSVFLGFPGGSAGKKSPPAMWETFIQSLGSEDPLEEGVATHSGILAWRSPWPV